MRNHMSQYEQPSGRFLELVVGLTTSFVALIFIVLFVMLVRGAGLQYISVFGGCLLLLAAYWFGLISFRLLFNVPNKQGGLLSVGGLKFLCLFLGVSSIAVVPLSMYMGHWLAALGSVGLVVGCYKGWQMAGNRGNA